MMSPMRFVGVLLLSALMWPPSSRAQEDDAAPQETDGDYDPRQMRTEGLDDEQARSRFRVGQALYEEGRFLEAAREFESSYELSNRASLLFNAYLSFRDAGRLADSVRVLGMYLEANPDVDDAERLQQRLAAMRVQLEEEQARERASQAERERLEAEQEQLRLERIRAEREAEIARERARRAEEGTGINPLGFIVGGAGVAMLVGAGITGAIAQTRVDELEENCPDGRCALAFDLDAKRDKADRAILTADILLFAGIATTAVGIGLLFLRKDDEEEEDPAPEVSFGCGPTGCNAHMSMEF